VLSRAWTRRWECVPSINLSADDGKAPPPGAINGILLRFPGRIRRFHITPDKATVGSVNDWLPAISGASFTLPLKIVNFYMPCSHTNNTSGAEQRTNNQKKVDESDSA
jgi:hypothetical protein